MKKLATDNNELLKNRPSSFLTADVAAGVTTTTVKNIQNFAVNQILCIGSIGSDTEIIKTHASTAPTGNTVTLASALVNAHLAYAVVRVIAYDQVEFSHAETETGSKTVLTTKGFTMNSEETSYTDMTYSSGYYFIRFKETVTNSFSDYSDAIPFAGLEQNTVGFVISYALKRNKLPGFTDNIDYQFCIDEINACLDFITGKLKGWSNLLKLNEVVGQTERGVLVLGDMPSDIWENKGNKSILDLRLGTSTGLTWLIWSDLEKKMEGVVHTQVRTEASMGDTTLEIDNSYDFEDTGSVNVYVSGTLQTLTYTGVTRSSTAGVLTGVPASGTGSITATIPVDTDVWDGETEGEPTYFSVNSDSEVVIWPLPSDSYENLNGYMDYYTGATHIDSDSDILDVWRYDMIKNYLTWAIRSQKDNDGKRDFKDGDYLQFLTILADYIRAEKPAHRRKRGIKINSITY